MHLKVSGTQLFGGTKQRYNVPVDLTVCCAFAVDCLRTGDDDFLDGQLVIADDLQHLSGAEAVHENVLGHLGHVAAVGCFMEDDVDVGQRGVHRLVVLNVPLAELGCRMDPFGLTVLVGLGLQIVQDADLPAFLHEEIDDVRTNQASPTCYEGSFPMHGHNITR